jgi:hypothetical protein
VIGFPPVLVRRPRVWLLVLLVSGASLDVAPSVASVVGGRKCDVHVRARASLDRAMSRHGPGTTYCLSRGTFRVTTPIMTDSGDRVIGAGRNDTFIDGSGLPRTADGIFLTEDGTYFSNLDISGAPTPAANSGIQCSPTTSGCGRAFSLHGDSLTLRSIDCHDNDGNCVSGGGSGTLTVDDLNCWNNGSPYSMTESFLYAACIKRAAVYSTPGNTTITNSYIHHNPWIGVWCDHCKYGQFDIQNTRFVRNGLGGILWEMSGGWTADDHAVIKNNIFKANNRRGLSYAGGMIVGTANDITISGNTFRRNTSAGISIIFSASRNPPQPDSRGVVARDNVMNGDATSGCSLAGVTCTNNS